MKTYVLTVSKTFPKTHKRAGERTFFREQILTALMSYDPNHGLKEKYHTIRSNYDLWLKRISEIQKGNAILSIRYWSGEPYNSKQVEICQLDKNSGIGVQELSFINNELERPCIFDNGYASRNSIQEVSKNDGLSIEDFKEWFKKYDLSKPMAIIHFTKFRY